MKMLLPLSAILCLLVLSPLGAKILILDANRASNDSSTFMPGEVATPRSSSAYQNDAWAKFGSWLASEEAATFGPLALGLLLLIVPVRFSRAKASSEAVRLRDEGNKLRRIGQSWDPRF